ncbi:MULTISPECIES: hypothetical protein [Helicobacter]|uniref:Uncharacterized protein n=2 Tax=Helicobacter ganmani TaxID=60246 RepID=A0A3D8IFX1_9HELI|nr:MULTISPECIES: hypothetical protein [Helicobacter]RDU63806.1 hypothetical protein CQA43_03020 [Helicobacter ganmani]
MENAQIFNIYLGQEEHYITLEEMDKIIQAVNNIGDSLTKKLFTSSSKEFFVVYPYEIGSFKIKIGIVGAALAIMSWLGESDLGKAFVKGLTGNETPYYAEKAGELLRDAIKGVLEKSVNTLEIINNNTDNKYILDKSIKEKSELYTLINKSKTIKSISFNPNNEEPIEKKNFYAHIRKGDIIRQLEPEYEICDLIILKSINTREQGKWTFGLLHNNKNIKAEISDNNFISGFLGGQYPLKEGNQDDIIKALVRTDTIMKNGNKESGQYFIQEIFNFNENKIKDIPKDLEKYLRVTYQYKEPTLFDNIQGE